MPGDDDRSEQVGREVELVELSTAECYELLDSAVIGRVATVTATRPEPLVVPVTYLLDENVIVFRTAPGSKLEGIRSSPASFEVDDFDPYHHVGWSVLVRGIAYEATPDEIGHLELEPWAPGPLDVWVRLMPRIVSGRRLVAGGTGVDWRSYL